MLNFKSNFWFFLYFSSEQLVRILTKWGLENTCVSFACPVHLVMFFESTVGSSHFLCLQIMLQNASLLENNSLMVNLYLNLNLAERLSLCLSKKDEGSKISFNLLVVKFQAETPLELWPWVLWQGPSLCRRLLGATVLLTFSGVWFWRKYMVIIINSVSWKIFWLRLLALPFTTCVCLLSRIWSSSTTCYT